MTRVAVSADRLILASRSPRRRELLTEAGYAFEVIAPSDEAEDGGRDGESPEAMVARLAYQKAADVAAGVTSGIVLGCDTVAVCEGEILGKPDDLEHARRMLHTLRGREHQVLSGLCLWKKPGDKSQVRTDTTVLRMDPLSDAAVEDYLAGGGWKGKAGAFGFQDRLGWIHVVRGSVSNIVGLPMELLSEMLAAF